MDEIIELPLKGAKLLTPSLYKDHRGFFFESHKETLPLPSFVQDNHSYSKKGVLRGMHFQSEQAKLIRVAVGQIYDVIVDIRPDSPTYMEWIGVELDGITCKQLFVPIGCAHGFQVLSEEAHVLYKVSSLFDSKLEGNFYFDDPDIGIKWPQTNPILSNRDAHAPLLRELL